jgi:hypothetical protein
MLWLGQGALWDLGARPRWRPAGRAQPGPPTVPQRHAGFDAWCQAHAGQACSLLLSAWLVHELLTDGAPVPASDQARLAHARGVLQHYHGEAALTWPLAAWQSGGRHGVSALHGLALPALQDSARRAGVRLRAVRPAWSLALATALQQAPALARAAAGRLLVVDGVMVSQIDLSRGALTGLQQRRLPTPTLPALQALAPDAADTVCVAIGHGLQPASDGQAVLGLRGIGCVGSLFGEAPAPLCAWHGEPFARRGGTAATQRAAA